MLTFHLRELARFFFFHCSFVTFFFPGNAWSRTEDRGQGPIGRTRGNVTAQVQVAQLVFLAREVRRRDGEVYVHPVFGVGA